MGVASLKERDALETMNELADRARLCFGISSLSRIKLIKYALDAEYLVEDSKTGLRALLYITGPESGKEKLEFGVLWTQELSKETNLLVPEPLLGLNGSYIQTLSMPYLDAVWYCVMYSVTRINIGNNYDPEALGAIYTKLGETAAVLHQDGIQWGGGSLKVHPPADYEALINRSAQSALLSVLPIHAALFLKTLRLVSIRLDKFGESISRYGLIHGSLDADSFSTVRNRTVIHNFYQCGYSWFLYDCAASLAPVMHLPIVSDLTAHWIEGYKKKRNLTGEDIAEIPTFLILHRLVLLDQMLNHSENCSRKISVPDFTETTAALCEYYISTHT